MVLSWFIPWKLSQTMPGAIGFGLVTGHLANPHPFFSERAVTFPKCSMVLEYLPTVTLKITQSGKYTIHGAYGLWHWYYTGWWFGTCILFFHNILGMSSSQLTHIFRGVGLKRPTSDIGILLPRFLSQFTWVYLKPYQASHSSPDDEGFFSISPCLLCRYKPDRCHHCRAWQPGKHHGEMMGKWWKKMMKHHGKTLMNRFLNMGMGQNLLLP